MRGVEVALRQRDALAAGAADGRLVAEVRELGAAQPARLAREDAEIDVVDRLVAGVDVEDREAARDVGRRDEDLTVEAAGPQERGIELVEQVRRGHDDDAVAGREAVHLDEQLVQRLLALGVVVAAAPAADGVELVDEDDRGRGLARLVEQPPDAGGAQAGEHLDERRGGLREELGAGLVRGGLRQQRLARARRAVEQDALRDLGPDLVERRGIAEEVDDLPELLLGLVDAGDVIPA